MNVIAFKLTSGEEVIGRFKESIAPGETITLESARTIGAQPTRTGELGIGLMPFAFSQQEGDVIIRMNAIMAEMKPDQRLVDIYLEQTSRIKLA